MSKELIIFDRDDRALAEPAAPATAGAVAGVPRRERAEAPVDPVVFVHSLLKGRYKWACALALLGAVAGVALAMKAITNKYTSTGLIRIRSTLPRVLYESDENGMLPMFHAYVDAQTQLIRSERVLAQAAQHPQWQALFPGTPEDPVAAFGGLDVRHGRGSEMVEISYTHPNPTVATTGVKVVIDTFRKSYVDQDQQTASQTLQILRDRRTALAADLAKLRQQLETFISDVGSDAVDAIAAGNLQELTDLKSELRRVQLAIVEVETSEEANAAGLPATRPAGGLTFDLLGAEDRELQRLTDEKRDVERQLAGMVHRYGPNHPRMTEARRELEWYEQQIKARLDGVAAAGTTTGPADSAAVAGASPTLRRLRAHRDRLQAWHDKTAEEVAAMAQKNLQVQAVRNDMAGVQQKLRETDNRIEQLSVESGASTRVEVISEGSRPTTPGAGKRVAAAGAGGVAGAAAAVMLVAAVGLVDRRVRRVADAQTRFRVAPQLIGAVPLFTRDRPEEAALAVHRIRLRLQLLAGSDKHQVFALTSPASGSGKTSMTVALGLSFAASGSRTLLIDADLVGGGLTDRMSVDSRPRLGQVLRARRLVSMEQLTVALREAKARKIRLGEALVQMGLVTETDVDMAVAEQANSRAGLLDAIRGEPVTECCRKTGANGLYVLPLGDAGAQDAAELSPATVGRVLAEARRHFDIVLVDTGPVLGSLEATALAAHADGVVLVVSRGDHQDALDAAFRELTAIGANVVGSVFNRAQSRDVATSCSTSSSVAGQKLWPAVRNGANGHENGEADGHGADRVDPVAALTTATGGRRPTAAGAAGAGRPTG